MSPGESEISAQISVLIGIWKKQAGKYATLTSTACNRKAETSYKEQSKNAQLQNNNKSNYKADAFEAMKEWRE